MDNLVQNLEKDLEKVEEKTEEKLPNLEIKTSKTGKKKLPKSPQKKSKNYKRGSLGKAIYAYFDKVGVDNSSYEVSFKLAKSIMPTTKYGKTHFSWYKNKYRELQETSKKTKKR